MCKERLTFKPVQIGHIAIQRRSESVPYRVRKVTDAETKKNNKIMSYLFFVIFRITPQRGAWPFRTSVGYFWNGRFKGCVTDDDIVRLGGDGVQTAHPAVAAIAEEAAVTRWSGAQNCRLCLSHVLCVKTENFSTSCTYTYALIQNNNAIIVICTLIKCPVFIIQPFFAGMYGIWHFILAQVLFLATYMLSDTYRS